MVDTPRKRFSIMEMDSPFSINIPIPDGSFDQRDRQQLLDGYAGILWAEPLPSINIDEILLPGVICRELSVSGMIMRELSINGEIFREMALPGEIENELEISGLIVRELEINGNLE